MAGTRKPCVGLSGGRDRVGATDHAVSLGIMVGCAALTHPAKSRPRMPKGATPARVDSASLRADVGPFGRPKGRSGSETSARPRTEADSNARILTVGNEPLHFRTRVIFERRPPGKGEAVPQSDEGRYRFAREARQRFRHNLARSAVSRTGVKIRPDGPVVNPVSLPFSDFFVPGVVRRRTRRLKGSWTLTVAALEPAGEKSAGAAVGVTCHVVFCRRRADTCGAATRVRW